MAKLLDDIDRRFDYVKPNEDRQARHEDLRAITKQYAEDVLTILNGESREASLAMTSLEEALFWANAHIARNT
jgi:hypothetical protein